MDIRKASASDLIEIHYLFHLIIREMNSRGFLLWDINHLLTENDMEKHPVFLYKENEVCRGMIFLKEAEGLKSGNGENNPENKSIEILCIVVHPIWRNQGIGKQLLKFAEQYSRNKGYSSLKLNVFAENKEALTLMDQLNYKTNGQKRVHFQEAPFICLEKCL